MEKWTKTAKKVLLNSHSNRGAWLEMETDAKDISYVRIDRTRKDSFNCVSSCFGFGSDDTIFEIFSDKAYCNTIEKRFTKRK